MKALLTIGDRVQCIPAVQSEIDKLVDDLRKVTIIPEYMVFDASRINASRSNILGKVGTILNVDTVACEYLIVFDGLGRKSCVYPGIVKYVQT